MTFAKIMINTIKESLFNTPEKYWTIIFGYHLHKSFLGTFLIFSAFIILFLYWLKFPTKHYLGYVGMIIIIIGVVLILLSIFGHIYTNNLPYFKLWDKYK